MDDVFDIIKVILALLFIFGGSFAKLLRKLAEVQRQAQKQKEQQSGPRAFQEIVQDSEADEEQVEAEQVVSWRYDQSEQQELHEDAHEDEEDYDLHEELDTELDGDRLDDHGADDELETRDEDVSAEPPVFTPAQLHVTNFEAESVEPSSEELVRESEDLEVMRRRIEAQVAALQQRQPPRVHRSADRQFLHGVDVRAASFVRDAIVLDLLFRRKATNPAFRLR